MASQSQAGASKAAADLKTGTKRGVLFSILESQALILLLFTLLLGIATGIAAPRFLKIDNLATVTRQTSFVALISLGQMLALIAGVIDVSVGATAGFSGVCSALLIYHTGVNPYLCLIAGLLAGVLVGLLNGFVVTRLGLDAFVGTLSTSFVVGGATLVLTRGWAVAGMPETIQWIGKGALGPVPVPTMIAIGTALLVSYLLNRTYIGRYIFAVGGNEEAAGLAGIRVGRVKTIVYILSGFLAAMSGVMMMTRLRSGQPTVGDSWLLPSFAAPVLGGAALSGGVGSTLGTLVGALLMIIIRNAIAMTGVSVYWQEVVVGTVLVVAVAVDSLRSQAR